MHGSKLGFMETRLLDAKQMWSTPPKSTDTRHIAPIFSTGLILTLNASLTETT